MIESQARSGVRVSTDDATRPYIKVPVDQLRRVREVLDNNQVSYWVEPNEISVGGMPPVAFINLAASADVKMVQALLDSAA
jgi:hypothetical protein